MVRWAVGRWRARAWNISAVPLTWIEPAALGEVACSWSSCMASTTAWHSRSHVFSDTHAALDGAVMVQLRTRSSLSWPFPSVGLGPFLTSLAVSGWFSVLDKVLVLLNFMGLGTLVTRSFNP